MVSLPLKALKLKTLFLDNFPIGEVASNAFVLLLLPALLFGPEAVTSVDELIKFDGAFAMALMEPSGLKTN